MFVFEYFESLLQVLVTSNDFTDPEFKDNLCGTVEDLLSMNVVPVFNENDAISKGAARSKVTASASLIAQAATSLPAEDCTHSWSTALEAPSRAASCWRLLAARNCTRLQSICFMKSSKAGRAVAVRQGVSSLMDDEGGNHFLSAPFPVWLPPTCISWVQDKVSSNFEALGQSEGLALTCTPCQPDCASGILGQCPPGSPAGMAFW